MQAGCIRTRPIEFSSYRLRQALPLDRRLACIFRKFPIHGVIFFLRLISEKSESQMGQFIMVGGTEERQNQEYDCHKKPDRARHDALSTLEDSGGLEGPEECQAQADGAPR